MTDSVVIWGNAVMHVISTLDEKKKKCFVRTSAAVLSRSQTATALSRCASLGWESAGSALIPELPSAGSGSGTVGFCAHTTLLCPTSAHSKNFIFRISHVVRVFGNVQCGGLEVHEHLSAE